MAFLKGSLGDLKYLDICCVLHYSQKILQNYFSIAILLYKILPYCLAQVF